MRLWVLPASGLAGASAVQRSADPPALDSDGASLAAQLTNVKESIIFLAKEATDADKAAKYYQDKLAAEIVEGGKLDQVTLDVEQKELERNHVSEWETELAQVDAELADPRPAQAEVAAKNARQPYDQAAKQYSKASEQFNQRAQAMVQRAESDSEMAKKLFATSNQYASEGDGPMAEELRQQARNLMQQASLLSQEASETHGKAAKLHDAVPIIEKEAEKAAAFASFQKNPTNAQPARYVVPLGK